VPLNDQKHHRFTEPIAYSDLAGQAICDPGKNLHSISYPGTRARKYGRAEVPPPLCRDFLRKSFSRTLNVDGQIAGPSGLDCDSLRQGLYISYDGHGTRLMQPGQTCAQSLRTGHFQNPIMTEGIGGLSEGHASFVFTHRHS